MKSRDRRVEKISLHVRPGEFARITAALHAIDPDSYRRALLKVADLVEAGVIK
jgi:hypothetical protein